MKNNSIEIKNNGSRERENLMTWNNMEEDKVLNLLAFLMKKTKT